MFDTYIENPNNRDANLFKGPETMNMWFFSLTLNICLQINLEIYTNVFYMNQLALLEDYIFRKVTSINIISISK